MAMQAIGYTQWQTFSQLNRLWNAHYCYIVWSYLSCYRTV